MVEDKNAHEQHATQREYPEELLHRGNVLPSLNLLAAATPKAAPSVPRGVAQI